MNPEFLRSRSARLDRSEDSIGTHSFVSDQSRIVNKYLRSGAFTMTWNLASSMGLDIRDPTMDKRVVEYCLGIPRDQYRHVGRQRMLFRRAMAGRLPDQVLWNPRRGLQSADITSRIQAERRDINETLHRFEAAPITRHYLNLGRLRSTFERLSQVTGPRAYGEAVNVLLRGVMIGLFLLASEEG